MFDIVPDPRQPTYLFELGRTVMTQGVLALMQQGRVNPAEVLHRHHNADWGDLDAEDKARNDQAILDGDRILSRYVVPTPDVDVPLYVITEANREVTTVLLASEY